MLSHKILWAVVFPPQHRFQKLMSINWILVSAAYLLDSEYVLNNNNDLTTTCFLTRMKIKQKLPCLRRLADPNCTDLKSRLF